jgi:hypothetical protein
MADKSPAQQIQELRDLVVGYAKQETVDPLKSLGKFIRNGLGGAVLLGAGTICVGIALLRFLQTSPWNSINGTGNSRWVPYLVTVLFLAIVAGGAAKAAQRRPKTSADKDGR